MEGMATGGVSGQGAGYCKLSAKFGQIGPGPGRRHIRPVLEGTQAPDPLTNAALEVIESFDNRWLW